MTDELLLTPEGVREAKEAERKRLGITSVRPFGIVDPPNWDDESILKAQVAEVLKRLKEALVQSRKGDSIDLPEEWFELFSSIQNDGIAKIEEAKREERERIIAWGVEPCDGDENHWGTLYEPPKEKRQCPQCWQALKGE